MRVRKLSTLFWTMVIFAFIFIWYVVTDLTFRLPGTKPSSQEVVDSKWSSLESKLRHIEHELSQHNAAVEEIKQSVHQIAEQPPQDLQLHDTNNFEIVKKVVHEDKSSIRESKLEEEPPKIRLPIDESHCAIKKQSIPLTDIQMLTMYERITFEDIDGGVWKQGWNIEYKSNQWSQKNKLKVFIVPHSHNDPGWIKTFENYYKAQTKAILNNMVEKLSEGSSKKFIWAETSYLYLWWRDPDTTDAQKTTFKNLLKSGQLEIVTGGWVMNDEANSHWLSVVQQLTTGQQWLLDNVDYIPKNSWSIDPFGYSSVQAYLYKLAGFDNAVIQRVHYRIKKELALNRQLEFRWRQLWDGTGTTDMFTHMMPFYSYDVPHSCGPDPKVCCQFDFKRLPGNGVSCPWGVAPRKIITKNVHERASAILDQWRKKAQLYRSNVLMFPLGDDFRYDRANEWDNQFQNYDMLIDYINNRDEWNTEVQFGTLQDYFKAVHAEEKLSNFPVLSGDFFTYADRSQHYWSGYFTSRPFYKNMDRVLLAYIRAAESLTALAVTSSSVPAVTSLQLRDGVEQARRALALFQHHDAVAGTSRTEVHNDYGIKLLKAIKTSQSVMQRAAYFLLKQPAILDQSQEDIYFDVDDIWRRQDEVPSRITIALDAVSPSRRLVLYNALAFERQEIFTVFVSTPHVQVYDPEGAVMEAQVSPVAAGAARLSLAAARFQLSFPASAKPLALTAYTVSLRDTATINKHTSYARVRVYNADYWTIDLPKMFAITQFESKLTTDITLQAGNATRVVLTKNGLIKALVSKDGTTTPMHMEFVKYDTDKGHDNNSGAYLFIPAGPAAGFRPEPFPEVVVVEGRYKSTLYTVLTEPAQADVMMAISVYDNPSLPQTEVEITNTLMINPQVDDLELAMRLSTAVRNNDVFYTDLNGMNMIRRRYFEKLPIQANYYPLPAAAYIEDDDVRVTLLTSTPLGVAALQPGSIEVMQDRRLSRDDNRGMNQGVLDNVLTRHTFRVIVEPADKRCQPRTPAEHPSGQLSLGAHVSQQQLLQPMISMQYSPRDDSSPHYSSALSSAADIVLASYRAHVSAKDKEGKIQHGVGMTFHRVYLDSCYGNKEISKWYPVGDGQVRITEIVEARPDQILESSLTHVRTRDPIPGGMLALCPMEVRSVFVRQN